MLSNAHRIVTVLAVLLLIAASTPAQTPTGNLYGRIVDSGGEGVEGVSVTLLGPAITREFITDHEGDFRFPGLPPGSTYSLLASRADYADVIRQGIAVNIGRNTDVTLEILPQFEETITVTAETPLLDARKTGTGATVTEVELAEIPSARDPWVILKQVPGVVPYRIDVGGNKSGQQPGFSSKGIPFQQTTYNVDGVETTDMIATGGSSSYYDFEAFEEIEVATGGSDPRIQTPGAQINMVTRRGTNEIEGSARYFLTSGDWQADSEVPAEAVGYLGNVDETDEITEWGLEVGGPILRDRLWAWGAYADQQIDRFTAQPVGQERRYSDNTTLETVNLKLNAQPLRRNHLTLFYYDNDKIKLGRGVGPLVRPEAGWNQSAYGPQGTWKIEDSHIVSPDLYLTALYSKVNGGFQLQPDSGADCRDRDCVIANATAATAVDQATGIQRNTGSSVTTLRPQEELRLDGSLFFDLGATDHELRSGLGHRTADTSESVHWPYDQLIFDYSSVRPEYDRLGVTVFFATAPIELGFRYTDAYAGDTIRWRDLTAQLGLRYDAQEAVPEDAWGPENSVIPQYLPEVGVPSSSIDTMEWESISPRISVTWAVGGDRSTLIRTAYNRYVDQMGGNSTGYPEVMPAAYRFVYLYTFDANDNDIIEEGEILDPTPLGWFGFDPDNPHDVRPPRRVDPGIDAPITDEILVGLEHELSPAFMVGIHYTHRRMNDLLAFLPEKTRGAGDYYTSADYELVHVITPDDSPDPDLARSLGGDYAAPFYDLVEGVGSPRFYVLTNRPDYHRTYEGIELTMVKRMSDRWMARGHVNWSESTHHVGPGAVIDPTPAMTDNGCIVCDGSEVIFGGRSGSRWTWSLTGVVQLPLIETNLGFSLSGQEGAPLPYMVQRLAPNERAWKNVIVTADDLSGTRLDDVFQMDLRLSKDFRLRGVGLQIATDIFNLTNEQVVLGRNVRVARSGRYTSSAGHVIELQSPTIVRLGARITF